MIETSPEMLFGFLNALIGTYLLARVAKFIVQHGEWGTASRACGFSAAIGFAFGRYSGVWGLTPEAALAASKGMGALLALGLLWLQWFRRKSDRNDERY